MSIIISENGKKAQKIDKSEFEKEDYLQNYIHENPESIPVYEIEENKRLFVVAREFSTESGPIDALAIDKDGDIYVVETKLYDNPDKRKVVAQALDYGASLWRHSDYNEFISKINNEINNKFKISFEEKIKDFFATDDEQVIAILDAIKRNLQQGNIKFVILMDAIEDRLKDLIVYINQNSQFDIYAVQMEYYKFEKYEIMIPKLSGVEVKKSVATGSPTRVIRKQDKNIFLQDAAKNLNPEKMEAITKLLDFSENYADQLTWGTGTSRSSLNPRFSKTGSTRSLYTLRSNGDLSLNFGWLEDGPEAIRCRDKFKDLVIKNNLFAVQSDYQSHFPRYKIEIWYKKVDLFIEIIKDLLELK